MTVLQHKLPDRTSTNSSLQSNNGRHVVVRPSAALERASESGALSGMTIAVAGCGPGGGIAALVAAKYDAKVTVFDAMFDERVIPSDDARSISLTLSCEFVDSLENKTIDGNPLGTISGSIKSRGKRIIGRSLCFPDGRTVSTDYGNPERDAFYAIPRNTLSQLIKNELEICDNTITVRNRWRVEKVDTKNKSIVARNLHCESEDCCAVKEFGFDRVIDAAGLNSTIRARLNQTSCASYSRKVSKEVYVPLHISRESASAVGLPTNRLIIWYGVSSCFAIGVPQLSGDVDVLLIGDKKDIVQLTSGKDSLANFNRLHPILAAIDPELLHQLISRQHRKFSTFSQSDWSYGTNGYVVGVGDAVHALPPYLGSGSVLAMQDSIELIECIARHPDNPRRAVTDYQRTRKSIAKAYRKKIPFQSQLLRFGLRGESPGTSVK